jgi:hypothetical protein
MANFAEKLGFKNYMEIISLGEEAAEKKQATQQGEVIDINGVGQTALQLNVTETSLGPALQGALDKLKTIYSSGDDVIIRAISENLNAFVKAVDYRQKVQDLEDGQNQLREELGGKIRHLEGIIEGLMGGSEGRKKRRS